MLQAIAILGGWLLMMGQHDRSESLFYYFRIEDQVPQNHLLRFIDRYVSFDFVREKLRASYSETGRPSIDPEVLLRILLLGYLYGITSERKLLEELRMHLAWRWFTGLGFEQEIPHHSTFSKNRHGRFQESNLFQELFERIVEQCIAAGLVEGEQMSVDGSFIMANASHHSRIPREQFTEAAQVNYGARKYLEELEQENGDGEPIHQQDKVSTTDPDSTYLTKGNRAAELGYFDNYLIDNESCVIVGVQATAARLSQESAAALWGNRGFIAQSIRSSLLGYAAAPLDTVVGYKRIIQRQYRVEDFLSSHVVTLLLAICRPKHSRQLTLRAIALRTLQ